MNANIHFQDTIPGGCHWSMVLKKGLSLRLIDEEGGANVGMLFYNPSNLLERYNAPDTLKCQHTFKLTRGNCLYSDMGRVFCSIVHDTSGWHDTVCGNTTSKIVANKWGERGYQQYRNDWYQNGYDAFLVEVAKYGLGKKDLAANLNLFSKVFVDDAGALQFDATAARAGSAIDLRFEMDTLVVFHTCPHPLNPATEYPKKRVRFQIYTGPAIDDDDVCKNHCAENQRGLMNTALYTLGPA
ncbi:MAG: urea carboxylase-associated family protein [Halioglobus sp.]